MPDQESKRREMADFLGSSMEAINAAFEASMERHKAAGLPLALHPMPSANEVHLAMESEPACMTAAMIF
ncbi:hypothetical protein [Roseomonas chloroacetimidivorans]|uniref:hypothetical protein n=1 Tax=Roseomonas chloroacetimidivorans TaxID=1766656 RepID=UPI003C792A59